MSTILNHLEAKGARDNSTLHVEQHRLEETESVNGLRAKGLNLMKV